MPNRPSAVLLDSSVAVKWFISEDGADRALGLLNRFTDGDLDLCLPDLALYEVANALLYSGVFEVRQIQEYVGSLLDLELEVFPFDQGCLAQAVELADALELAIYDAYFAACALANGMRFLTADARAARKMRALPFVDLL